MTSKAEFMKGYPEGPVAAWKVIGIQTVYPGYIFCQIECRGDWIKENIKLGEGVIRGNMDYDLVEKPVCCQCHRPLWS